jgi:hypothetical protein
VPWWRKMQWTAAREKPRKKNEPERAKVNRPPPAACAAMFSATDFCSL